MNNPWKKINTIENLKVPKADEKYLVDLLNSKKYKNFSPENKLILDIYPQHFVGNLYKSDIIILGLNPGYNQEYSDLYKEKGKSFHEVLKLNLQLDDRTKFHAFDYSTSQDKGYWGKKLYPWFKNEIDEKILNNEKQIESKELDDYFTRVVSIAEFFPYHSAKYKDFFDTIAENNYLPSQQFVFDLIRKRVKDDDVVIIISRSNKKWYKAIPELLDYDKCFELSNPQNTSFKFENIYKITRTNCGQLIRETIKKK